MDKPGPPVEGLFDQIASPKSSTPLTTSSPARRQVSIFVMTSITVTILINNLHSHALSFCFSVEFL